VRPGGAIDDHARANTTSVYTAAGVFPMLPLRLSTDLSSLNENQDRLAIVIEIAVGEPGTPGDAKVYRAQVRNKAQLSYNGVAGWLDGKAPMPAKVAGLPGLEEQLRTQDRAGRALKELRRRHGALGLSTPEARPVFGSDGVLTDLRTEDGNRAKELIAGFMIAANGVTARFLDARNFPSLRRFLREPARWQKIAEIAAGFGETLPAEPSPIALDAFLTKRRLAEPAKFAELSLTIVKLLGSGEYMLSRPGHAAPGHFGLAVNDYTHSTAPNRRYPDLITQRLLKAALRGAPPPLGDDALTQLAQHCTEQEDNANKVERQVRKSAAALLLAPRIGQTFNAFVTGVSGKGTWVRIASPVAEGRVVRGFEGLDVGDKPRVTLVGVDAARGFIDFERAT
jgi:exoribonuclease II